MKHTPASRHMHSRLRQRQRPASQHGSMLIEALVAIAIFSFGILGMVGLQAAAIQKVRDADHRSRASLFASQIVGQMWSDRANVASYALNAGNAACAGGSSTAGNAAVTGWLAELSDSASPGSLPGANSLQHQIKVATDQTVNVTVCWKSPQDVKEHNFTLTTQIQG